MTAQQAKELLEVKARRVPKGSCINSDLASGTISNLQVEIDQLEDEQMELTMMKAEKEDDNTIIQESIDELKSRLHQDEEGVREMKVKLESIQAKVRESERIRKQLLEE